MLLNAVLVRSPLDVTFIGFPLQFYILCGSDSFFKIMSVILNKTYFRHTCQIDCREIPTEIL